MKNTVDPSASDKYSAKGLMYKYSILAQHKNTSTHNYLNNTKKPHWMTREPLL